MRDKIIQYLREIKCEWFPVEWDPFMAEYIQSVKGCDHEGMKIKYRFEEHFTIINYSRDIECQMFYYSNLDRCKTLLLNAVRSADEPKRKNRGGINGVPSYYEYKAFENLIQINAVYETRISSRRSTVWQNGEFK